MKSFNQLVNEVSLAWNEVDSLRKKACCCECVESEAIRNRQFARLGQVVELSIGGACGE